MKNLESRMKKNWKILRTQLFRVLLSFVILLNLAPLFSLPKGYLTNSYSSIDGLSHNITTTIHQDQHGFLWIGTYSGLNRFDGYEFKVFGLSEGLVYRSIRALAEDKKNDVLWIGTERGVSIYKNGKITSPQTIHKSLSEVNVRSMVVDNEGFVFIGNVDGVLVYKNGNIENISFETKSSNHTNCLFTDSKNRTWVGTKSGLFLLENYQLKKMNPFESVFENKDILSISESSQNKILVSIVGEGIYQIEPSTLEAEKFFFVKEQVHFTGNWYIHKSQRGLSFASAEHGLWIESEEGYIRYEKQKNLQEAIGLLQDMEGNIWVPTYGRGLVKFYPERVTRVDSELGLKDPTVRYIFRDSSDRLWVGGNQEITIVKNGKVDQSFASNGSVKISKVRFIVQDTKDKVWFASHGGLLYYDGKKILHQKVSKEIDQQSIYAMAIQNDKLYIALENKRGFLFEYSIAENSVKEIRIDKAIDIGIIWQILSAKDAIVLQGPNGVIKYSNEKFSSFQPIPNSKASIYEKLIYISDSQYILSTEDIVYVHIDGIEQQIYLSKIIRSAQVAGLLYENKTLWICTSRGVVRYKFDSSNLAKYLLFDERDGLSGNNSMFHAIESDSANIYIGSSKGLSIFEKNSLSFDLTLPNPIVTKFLVNKKEDSIRSLSHEENDIEIYFSGMVFSTIERIKYRYKLDGLDSGWVPWTNRNFAIYNNLPPGNYTFRVEATYNEDLKNNPHSTLQIIIEPAFYQTKFFYFISICLVLALFYSGFQVRLNQIKKQNQQLEKLVQERTVELVIEKNKSDKLLLNILPYQIATELKNNSVSEPRQYSSVTVVFTDFVGFTGISEKLSATEIVKKLDQYFMLFDTILEKYTIEKLKTIGDGYMAAGGIPTINYTHPVDCILAFLEVIRKMQDDKLLSETALDNWSIRVGINTGPLVAGVIGKKKFAYDVWGDTVNTASRLESSSMPNRINISQNTYQRIKDFFECEYRGKVSAKGKGDIDMFFVKSIHADLSIDGKGIEPNEKFYEKYSLLR
jgi:class 3 adenylate cyclase/ligand-binding sensor domain-containing protein